MKRPLVRPRRVEATTIYDWRERCPELRYPKPTHVRVLVVRMAPARVPVRARSSPSSTRPRRGD